jgi:hypothetical protein
MKKRNERHTQKKKVLLAWLQPNVLCSVPPINSEGEHVLGENIARDDVTGWSPSISCSLFVPHLLRVQEIRKEQKVVLIFTWHFFWLQRLYDEKQLLLLPSLLMHYSTLWTLASNTMVLHLFRYQATVYHFLILVTFRPIQPHQSIFSVIFFSLFLAHYLFWHSFVIHHFSIPIKVKVKFFLEQATKAQRGSRGIALLFR